MNKEMKAPESATTAAGRPAAARRPNSQMISHPVEVAAALMSRINHVNAKKDELTIAIKGLTDLTQQLSQAYAGQVRAIQQLNDRVKALEAIVVAKKSANGAEPHTATQG
jgi:hypothetical protein